MADDLQVTAAIEVKGTLAVGDNPQPSNEFKLIIKNQGKAITPPEGGRILFYFTGNLGSAESALFLNETDARTSEKKAPDGWKADWKFPANLKDKFVVEIYTFDNDIAEGGKIEITFSKVISKTGAGDASLGFGADLKKLQNLTINKSAPKPGIIAFYADPPADITNLPGDAVTLKWRTYQLGDRKLQQSGVTDPLLADFSKDEGSYAVRDLSMDVTFILSGYGPPPDSRILTVKVLQPGWYPRTHTISEGDPAYPVPADKSEADALAKLKDTGFKLEPVELFNANNQRLYAVFRYLFPDNDRDRLPDKERAFLFKTENPFGRWTLVQSSGAGQPDSIPEGFAASPGVYFDDRLWLIGGSQIDPDNTSNIVWRFDPKTGVWQNLGAAAWPRRMGHAILVFQNRIWLMGGRDAAGNALNDVWSCDASGSQWKCESRTAAWEPRCLFRPAVLGDEIWLYGGMKEPFSSELYSDLYVYSSGKWEPREMTSSLLENKKPLASALQVFHEQLRLFGKFRSISSRNGAITVEPLAFSLSDPDTRTWQVFPTKGLEDWGSIRGNTFNCQLINFQDKMLIAKALAYDEPNTTLKIYVPTNVAAAAMRNFRRV